MSGKNATKWSVFDGGCGDRKIFVMTNDYQYYWIICDLLNNGSHFGQWHSATFKVLVCVLCTLTDLDQRGSRIVWDLIFS